MTTHPPASHKPARWRPVAALLAAATAALALATLPMLTASAARAPAPRPSIASVSFSGAHGPPGAERQLVGSGAAGGGMTGGRPARRSQPRPAGPSILGGRSGANPS